MATLLGILLFVILQTSLVMSNCPNFLNTCACAQVYWNWNCGFRFQTLLKGTVNDNLVITGWNDVISSIVVQKGCTLKVWWDILYKGKMREMTGVTSNLENSGWNDVISSYKCSCSDSSEQDLLVTQPDNSALLNGTHTGIFNGTHTVSYNGTANGIDSAVVSNQVTGSSNLLPSNCVTAGEGDSIIGGTEVPMQSFVWIALIGIQTPEETGPSWDCGGSLISKRYVVTAAHCNKNKIIRVRLGEHDLSKTQDCQFLNNKKVCAPPVQDFNPEYIIVHPSYNTRSIHSDDILLIRLDRPAEFNSYVQPICLPPLNLDVGAFLNGREAEVAGWGITDTELEIKSDVKRIVKVPLEKMEKCGYGNTGIHGGKLCFGGERRMDSCAGGPLVSTDLSTGISNSYKLLGVVSFGPVPCGKDRPAVYTDVGHYRNWIESNLRP